MVQKLPEVPFRIFLYAAVATQIVYGVPTAGALLLFDFRNAAVLLIILLFIAVIAIPIIAALAWLIAKGSNWVNTPTAMLVVCSYHADFYGVLCGGWLGYRLFGMPGGIAGAVLLYLITRFTRIPVGKLIANRFLPGSWPTQ